MEASIPARSASVYPSSPKLGFRFSSCTTRGRSYGGVDVDLSWLSDKVAKQQRIMTSWGYKLKLEEETMAICKILLASITIGLSGIGSTKDSQEYGKEIGGL